MTTRNFTGLFCVQFLLKVGSQVVNAIKIMKRLKNAANLQCTIVLQYMISRIVLVLQKKILQYIVASLIQSHFDELANNYIKARMTVLADTNMVYRMCMCLHRDLGVWLRCYASPLYLQQWITANIAKLECLPLRSQDTSAG